MKHEIEYIYYYRYIYYLKLNIIYIQPEVEYTY